MQRASERWKIDRRGFGQSLLASSLLVLSTRPVFAAPESFTLGAALRADQLGNRPLMRLAKRHFRSITPETELKWDFAEREEGQFDLQPALALASFARHHRMRMRGHTLVWHRSIPVWVRKRLVRGADWRLVADYVTQLVPVFDELVDEWDVINEPLDPDGGLDGLRISPFLTAYGRDYIPKALALARSLSPKSMLFVNEYGLVYAAPDNQARRDALIKLVDWLQSVGAPLDGIGIQSHLDLAKGPFDSVAFGAFLDALAVRGLRVTLSELDVKEREYTLPVEQRDALVAAHVSEYLDVALSRANVTGITTWGLSDSVSWLDDGPQDHPQSVATQKVSGSIELNRGLPFDARFRKKPMWHAIIAALRTHRPMSRFR